MKLHELKATPGSRKGKVRRGRGNASGRGNFSGRGCKGQNARAGGGVRIGFEGGQTPLLQRIPKKKGFRSPNRKPYATVNLELLEKAFAENAVVSPATLKEKGLIRRNSGQVKILSEGELTKKLTFEDVIFSAQAQEKAEKAGGKIIAPKKEVVAEQTAAA